MNNTLAFLQYPFLFCTLHNRSFQNYILSLLLFYLQPSLVFIVQWIHSNDLIIFHTCNLHNKWHGTDFHGQCKYIECEFLKGVNDLLSCVWSHLSQFASERRFSQISHKVMYSIIQSIHLVYWILFS